MKKKIIKDCVHNYIEIEVPFFDIIDTAGFQRLKSVKQTSYSSLYPSSTHDRFTHSLGTYYLGKVVIDNLFLNMSLDEKLDTLVRQNEESIKFTFKIACLLHDYGHAPFSHTGEEFYNVKKISKEDEDYDYFQNYIESNKISNFSYVDYLLINELCKATKHSKTEKIISDFLDDYKTTLRENSAKPHEKISALLSLQELLDKITTIAKKISEENINFNPDLFIRCITGTLYRDERKKVNINSFYNTIIQLLNSDCIDVDKLDYLMRDTFMTGHKSTDIDVDRLISSFTVVAEKNKTCRLAFKKKGLSVIENVIQASDASKRWVQNHPVIIYDSYLTQRCIAEMIRIFSEKDSDFSSKLFSIDALTEKGIDIAGDHYFLLSDMDLINLLKKAYYESKKKGDVVASSFFEEFFSREKRRHPLWKSEMEYNICFFKKDMDADQSEIFEKLLSSINSLEEFRMESGIKQLVFNDAILARLEKDQMSYPQNFKNVLNMFKQFFQNNNLNFDITIILTTSFVTKKGKLQRKDFLVEMPNYGLDEWNKNKILYSYADLVSIKTEEKCEKMFYLYSNQTVNIKSLIKYIFEQSNL